MTARLDDWDTLSAAWRADTTDAPLALNQLRRTVQQRQRELMALFVGEITLTLFVVAILVRALRGGLTRASLASAALLVCVTLIVWAFTYWNRRGLWRPLAETTREYLRLSRDRIAAGRRTVMFVRASAAVYAVAYGSWFAVRASRQAFDAQERMIWVFAATYLSLLLAWSVWYTRRLTIDVKRVDAIERLLGLSEAA